MRLKRDTYSTYADPDGAVMVRSSAGRWLSADGIWLFWALKGRWGISASFTGGAGQRERQRLLEQTGLRDATFPSRRAAVAALALVLAGVSS